MTGKFRKGQEEMVGFVMIIVLVSVIALVFLVISIRKPTEMRTSKEVESFLHSALLFTSSCQSSSERVYDFKDLIEACLKNERCLDEENSCDVLNNTASELIETSFSVGENARYKAYNFKIYEENETLISLRKGNYTSSITGGELLLYISARNLNIRLELYY